MNLSSLPDFHLILLPCSSTVFCLQAVHKSLSSSCSSLFRVKLPLRSSGILIDVVDMNMTFCLYFMALQFSCPLSLMLHYFPSAWKRHDMSECHCSQLGSNSKS